MKYSPLQLWLPYHHQNHSSYSKQSIFNSKTNLNYLHLEPMNIFQVPGPRNQQNNQEVQGAFNDEEMLNQLV